MNNFAHIKPIVRYKMVAYYSICVDGSKSSLFDDFILKHGKTEKNKVNHILEWIKQIGNKYGAQPHLFRSEGETADTSALPPNGMERKPHYTESGNKKANNLRLYCHRTGPNVVILFGGDLKTAKRAQECPNVKPHFKLANRLSKAIDKAFMDNEIRWNHDFTVIECDNDFELQF